MELKNNQETENMTKLKIIIHREGNNRENNRENQNVKTTRNLKGKRSKHNCQVINL
jgi:hypothetical protein